MEQKSKELWGQARYLEGQPIGCTSWVKACAALAKFYTPGKLELRNNREARRDAGSEERPLREKLAQDTGVWVFIEQDHGEAAKVSWELLGIGSDLAKILGVELSAVLIGHNVFHLCGVAFSFGADQVFLLDAPVYKHYRTQPYTEALCHLIEKHKPEVFIMGATGQGNDLAGAVSMTLGTSLAVACTGLDIDGRGNLVQAPKTLGGKIIAPGMCDRLRPQMATVRPHVLAMPPFHTSRQGKVIRENFTPNAKDV